MWGAIWEIVDTMKESRREYLFADYVFGTITATALIFTVTLLSLLS